MLTYRSTSGRDFKEVEDGVRKLMEQGYQVIKVQVAAPGATSGYAVPSSPEQKAADEEAHRLGRGRCTPGSRSLMCGCCPDSSNI